MKQAQGFVTEDGTFFESPIDAALYEAETQLRTAVVLKCPGVDPNKLLGVVAAIIPELGRYIDAYRSASAAKIELDREAANREAPDDGLSTEVATGTGHVSSAEKDLAALLELPTRRLSHVPDVGSGARTEEVQVGRTKHGPRVRRNNASGVRSGKDMATKPSPEA